MKPEAPSSQDQAALHPAPEVEAARYALLRRLAPSMRHHLVVHLQPIGMVHEVMERRLKAAEPNLAEIIESAGKIRGFARAALGSSVDMITWLAPDESAVTTVPDAVRECLGLVATSFTFRGFALRDNVGTAPGDVRKAAIRTVLTAALFHLSDVRQAPAEISITADPSGDSIEVTLREQSVAGDPGFSTVAPYRELAWGDLHALATAEGVGLARASDNQLSLRFQLTAPPA